MVNIDGKHMCYGSIVMAVNRTLWRTWLGLVNNDKRIDPENVSGPGLVPVPVWGLSLDPVIFGLIFISVPVPDL